MYLEKFLNAVKTYPMFTGTYKQRYVIVFYDAPSWECLYKIPPSVAVNVRGIVEYGYHKSMLLTDSPYTETNVVLAPVNAEHGIAVCDYLRTHSLDFVRGIEGGIRMLSGSNGGAVYDVQAVTRGFQAELLLRGFTIEEFVHSHKGNDDFIIVGGDDYEV